jgi:hypothetical protein
MQPSQVAGCASRRRFSSPASVKTSVRCKINRTFPMLRLPVRRTNRLSAPRHRGDEAWSPIWRALTSRRVRSGDMLQAEVRDGRRRPTSCLGASNSNSGRRPVLDWLPQVRANVCITTGVKLRGPEGAQRLRATSASTAELCGTSSATHRSFSRRVSGIVSRPRGRCQALKRYPCRAC